MSIFPRFWGLPAKNARFAPTLIRDQPRNRTPSSSSLDQRKNLSRSFSNTFNNTFAKQHPQEQPCPSHSPSPRSLKSTSRTPTRPRALLPSRPGTNACMRVRAFARAQKKVPRSRLTVRVFYRLEQAALSPRKSPSPVEITESLQAAEERRQVR